MYFISNIGADQRSSTRKDANLGGKAKNVRDVSGRAKASSVKQSR